MKEMAVQGGGPKKAIPVLYEDNHLLVVVKPVNMPTQQDATNDEDLLNALKADLKRRYNKPGNVFLGLVHRLDRPVGGVMVFAKTSKAASRLSEAVRSRAFEKTYLAVAHGTPKRSDGRLVHYLVKDPRENFVSVAERSAPGAKEAVLDYEVLGEHHGLCLVRVRLLTGRPHQIRVQLAAVGCPLYGDQKYGGRHARPGRQIALWSSHIAFPHPVTRQPVGFTAAPPDEYPWNLFG